MKKTNTIYLFRIMLLQFHSYSIDVTSYSFSAFCKKKKKRRNYPSRSSPSSSPILLQCGEIGWIRKIEVNGSSAANWAGGGGRSSQLAATITGDWLDPTRRRWLVVDPGQWLPVTADWWEDQGVGADRGRLDVNSTLVQKNPRATVDCGGLLYVNFDWRWGRYPQPNQPRGAW